MPAVVKITVSSSAAGLEMADWAWLGWFAHVKNEKTFRENLIFIASPARRDAFKPGDHLPISHLNLDRPGILRTGYEGDEFQCRWIGNVEDAPAAMPQVRQIEIPAAIHFLHRQLESGLAVEIVVTENLGVVGEISLWDRLSHS